MKRNKLIHEINSPRRLRADSGTLLSTAQFRLSIVWILGTIIGLGTMLLQTVFGAYGGAAEDAWKLFAPLYISILSVLLGSLVSGAMAQPETDEEKIVRTSYYRICMFLSIGANFIYAGSLWLQPVMIASGTTASAIDALKLSMLWVVPIQGVVSIGLGGLFGASYSTRKAG